MKIFTFIKHGNNNPEFKFSNLNEFLQIPIVKSFVEYHTFRGFELQPNSFGGFVVRVIVSDIECWRIGRIDSISEEMKKEIEGYHK